VSEIAIVADDLTGALDSVVHFAHHGRVALLIDAPTQDFWGVAVSTASRALSPAQARAAAERATELVASDRLYVKVDSTLRGNPAEHLAGALAAWRTKVPTAFAVICPALPIMGRTVRDGAVLDHLVPITRSAAARDPLPSARSADLTEVFPGSVRAIELAAALREGHDIVVDASTNEDLDVIAAAIEPYGRDVVAVGSAGLAAAIARRRTAPALRLPVPGPVPVGRTLILLTSLHPAARAQLTSVSDRLDVVATPPWSDTSGSVSPHDATAVAHDAAVRAAQMLATGAYGSLLIIGGDGAHALLAVLGALSFEVAGELLPGVPLGTLVGGTAPGLTVATRSGGFGGPTHLTDILTALHPLKEIP
jgi:uncharacterized protein YgbK (DUF1537 family)